MPPAGTSWVGVKAAAAGCGGEAGISMVSAAIGIGATNAAGSMTTLGSGAAAAGVTVPRPATASAAAASSWVARRKFWRVSPSR